MPRAPKSAVGLRLPFRLLIDECLASRELIGRAREAGHDVVSSRDVLGEGASDHDGIFPVFEDADRRDMSPRDVVDAFEHVRRRNPDSIANELIILNHFRG